MIDVLLFNKNVNLDSEKKKDERIESFGKTLNDAFKQFQKLWEDYKELLDKCKESDNSSSNISHKVQNVDRNNDVQCRSCAAAKKENLISEKKSSAEAQEEEVDCGPITVTKSCDEECPEPASEQIFQIFSQDFCTPGLEESFGNQSKVPLQEIQNVSPTKRSRSPILGSKKGKTRILLSPVSSPNHSEKSVVILDDFNNDKDSRIEKRSISSPLLDSKTIATAPRTLSSPIQPSSSAVEVGAKPTQKSTRKWGISTSHNVNTDIIVGTKKKLKQSRLFVKTDVVTDLSTCDDDSSNKSNYRNRTTNDDKNCTLTNNNCLEDSVIQGSPEHEKVLSRTRQRITRKNKSAETIQQRLNADGCVMKNIKQVENPENTNNDVHLKDMDMTMFDPKLSSTQFTRPIFDGRNKCRETKNIKQVENPESTNNDVCLTDTDMTIFDPKLSSTQFTRSIFEGRNKHPETKNIKHVENHESTNNDVGLTDTDITIFNPKLYSTQYTNLPSCSKNVQDERSLVKEKEKEKRRERMDLEDQGENDSDVVDETIFEETIAPSNSRSQRKLNYEKSMKRKKLSLKKINKNSGVTSSDKKNTGSENDTLVSVSSSEELKVTSPPKKKIALANFDVPRKKKIASPTYAYQSGPVRNKAERALLNGWSCHDCQKYYEAIGLDEGELQKRKNECSRHRSKFNNKKASQQDYWDPDFSSSYHSTMWSDD